MNPAEIARELAYARRQPGTHGVNNDVFVALADLVKEREQLLDDWKVVMRRSPIGKVGPELAQATRDLMRAEENVRAAIGFEQNNHD